MAVYTKLTNNDIRAFLAQYKVGALTSAKGIAEGVENTNYLIVAGKERYILTIFESRTDPKELPFFLGLTEWLAERDIPCPRPVHGKNGKVMYPLKGKSAILVQFLQGRNNPNVSNYHLQQLGAMSARMHMAAKGYTKKRPNILGLAGWKRLFARVEKRCDEITPGLADLIRKELSYLEKNWPSKLPSGVVHADLFPDNVFFKGDELSGVIDFYFSCNDAWMYDLMITLNAWCFDGSHRFVGNRAKALLQSYHAVRPITPEERAAMQVLARGAAMRFLLTRTYDWLNRIPGAVVTPKDPLEYAAKLIFHQQNRL
jgi:homoserine kinase type II